MAKRIAAMLAVFAAGAAVQHFFLDRRNAARRRHVARDRTLAIARRRSREAKRRAKYYEGVAEGVVHKTAQATGAAKPKEPLDDVSLAQKVESVAFRSAHVSKAHVSVNAERGVVYLRGQLDSDREIEALVRAAGTVEGVERVESLLHTPIPGETTNERS